MSVLFSLAGGLVLLLGVATTSCVAEEEGKEEGKGKGEGEQVYTFNSAGELIQPEGYREWIFVGAPVTPNELNKGKAPFPEFHAVYIHPSAYEEWKKTGTFKDGTILVKELISVGSKEAVSGKGYFMGEYLGLEATIKDSKRFKDEPAYWAYFSFTREGEPPAKTAEMMPTDKCNECHDSHADDDWVFTQYYPVLRAAKPGS
jgi:hypothetical protein